MRYQAKSAPKGEAIGKPVEIESRLHEDIEAHCKSMGWYYVHSRMDMPSTNGVGTPDFIIALPNGKTLWCEAKARKKKPRTEQIAAGMMLKKFGHHHGFVWNYQQFCDLLIEASKK